MQNEPQSSFIFYGSLFNYDFTDPGSSCSSVYLNQCVNYVISMNTHEALSTVNFLNGAQQFNSS